MLPYFLIFLLQHLSMTPSSEVVLPIQPEKAHQPLPPAVPSYLKEFFSDLHHLPSTFTLPINIGYREGAAFITINMPHKPLNGHPEAISHLKYGDGRPVLWRGSSGRLWALQYFHSKPWSIQSIYTEMAHKNAQILETNEGSLGLWNQATVQWMTTETKMISTFYWGVDQLVVLSTIESNDDYVHSSSSTLQSAGKS